MSYRQLVERALGAAAFILAFFHRVAPGTIAADLRRSKVLMGVFDAMKKVKFKPGEDFEIVVFSFDREEGPQDAARKRGELMETTGRPVKKGSFLEGKFDHRTVANWHFLVGGEDAINKVCDGTSTELARTALVEINSPFMWYARRLPSEETLADGQSHTFGFFINGISKS